MRVVRMCFLAAAALLLGACASGAPEPEPEPEFGSSVRHMIRAQTFDPAAGKAAQPPAAMDGRKSEGAVKTYRSGKGRNGTGAMSDDGTVSGAQ